MRSASGVSQRALAREIGVGRSYVGVSDPAPGAAGELTRRLGGPLDHRSDLIERQLEHVVEDEGKPLRGRQRVEHDEEREAHRVGEQYLLLGMELAVPADHRIGQVLVEGLLTSTIA